jgi:hypothetical protein
MKKLLVALTIGLIAASAMAQQGTTYGWWETYFTIAGQQFEVTTWSTDSKNGTDLGVLNLAGFVFSVSAVNGNIWSKAQDRGGMNFMFNTCVNTVQDAAGHDWWTGNSALTHVSGNNYTLSAGPSGNIGSTVLQNGDTVGIVMWGKTYGTSGDEWYSDNGNNYHAFFTVGDPTPIPEPATMGLLGLGALAMVIRRKLSK